MIGHTSVNTLLFADNEDNVSNMESNSETAVHLSLIHICKPTELIETRIAVGLYNLIHGLFSCPILFPCSAVPRLWRQI